MDVVSIFHILEQSKTVSADGVMLLAAKRIIGVYPLVVFHGFQSRDNIGRFRAVGFFLIASNSTMAPS